MTGEWRNDRRVEKILESGDMTGQWRNDRRVEKSTRREAG